MFKGASDKSTYLDRTASHSTKEWASGRIDAVPPFAQEAEDYYRSLRNQYDRVLDQLFKANEAVHNLKVRLRQTLPHEEYKRCQTRYDDLIATKLALEASLTNLRPMVRAAAQNAWGIVYWHVAQRILDVDTRIKIEEQVREFLQREPTDGIKRGSAELSENKRHSHTVRKNRKTRLNNLRMGRGGNLNVLVYSDENSDIRDHHKVIDKPTGKVRDRLEKSK